MFWPLPLIMDDEVDSRFMCSICCEVLKQPTVIRRCGHTFCDQCLRSTPRNRDGSIQCPLCRVPFHMETDCIRDIRLESEITQTITFCHGCGQRFSLLYFNEHSVNCPKRNQPIHHFTPVAATSQQFSVGPNRSTFNCPLCAEGNMDCTALLEHVNRHHSKSQKAVVCPVCASMPWGNSAQTSQNFVSHINMRHKFEYDTYVDYEQDDDASLRAAIEASLRDQ